MDLAFGQDPEGTPLVSENPESDISGLLQAFGQSPTTTGKSPSSSISDEDIERQLAVAIDAIGKVAGRTVPAYQSPDSAKYLDAVRRVRDTATGTVRDVEKSRADFDTASNQEKQAIQAAATAGIEKTNADQAKAQQIADIAYKVNAMVGVDGNADRLSEKVGVFHQLNDEYLAREQASQTLRDSVQQDAAKLREETSVSFSDDPIRWLEGIFTIPKLTDTVEAGVNQIKIEDNKLATLKEGIMGVQGDINESLAAAKDAFEARSRTVPAITAAQAAAQNNLTAAQATEKAAAADKEMARQDAGFAGQKLAEVVTAESAERGAQVLAQQNAELTWKSGIQQIAKQDSDAKAKIAIVELMSKIQDNQQVAGVLRMFETRTGLPAGSMTLSRYKALPDRGKEYVFGMAAGFSGATPGDAYFNIRDAAAAGLQPGPALSEQTDKMLRTMRAYTEQQFTQKAVQQELAGKNKDQQRAVMVQKVNEKFAEWQANPTIDPQNNPYFEQSPQNVALQSPSIAKTKIGKILQPYITSSSAPSTDQVISALRDGAASPDEASSMISQYYQLNTKIKNAVTDFQAFGAKPVTSYLYTYKMPGPVFGSSTGRVDLTNKTEVSNMLLRQQKSKELTEGINAGNAANRGF